MGSVLAKVLKCCRCQGDPPKICTECCDPDLFGGGGGNIQCCYGRNDTLVIADEVQGLTHDAQYVRKHSNGEIQETHHATATQIGDSYQETPGSDECRLEVPIQVSLSHHRYFSNGDPQFPQLECTGTGVWKMRIGPYENGRFWQIYVDDVFDADIDCTEGNEQDFGSYFGELLANGYVPPGQLTDDTCENGSQSTTLSRSNNQPQIATWSASVSLRRRIFGCVVEPQGNGWNCPCQVG